MNKEKLLSALIAVGVTMLVAFLLATLSTGVIESYGLGIFIITPVVCGAVSVIIFNRKGKKLMGESLLVALLSGCFALFGFLVVGFEGMICLIMALPLALPLFVAGGFLGFLVSRAITKRRHADIASILFVMLVPLLTGFEKRVDSGGPLRSVVTKIVIQGTVDQVWKEVVGFSTIPEPKEFLFRIGIAYPVDARIEGHGVGAVRYCRFSTGDFVEPITCWDEGRKLAFDVAEQPLPMTELSPYMGIHPPHLDWAVVSERGEFLLTDLGDGRVELAGTTWFRTVMEPEPYWGWLSDLMIHSIHNRVLDHIKTVVEGGDGESTIVPNLPVEREF